MRNALIGLAASAAACGVALAGTPEVFDGFVDGAVALSAVEGDPDGGNYQAPSVPAGRRTIAFICSTGSATLTLEPSAQTLEMSTDGAATCFLGYGYSTIGGAGVFNDYENRLNADWSDVRAIRFPIVASDTRVSLTLDAGTQRLSFEPDPHQGSSRTDPLLTDEGWTGDLDIPLDDFVGAVDWADVDRFLIIAQNGLVDGDFTLGPIQLLPATVPGDLDGDGSVGAADLGTLLAAWGPCDGECPADLDGDGAVGASDLGILIAAWG